MRDTISIILLIAFVSFLISPESFGHAIGAAVNTFNETTKGGQYACE